MRWTCNRTSKDLKLFFLPSLLLDKILTKTKILTNKSIRNNLADFNNVIPPERILLKIFIQKNPHKRFQKKLPKNIQKLSKQFLKKFLRFWKYPIPYITLGGQKLLRACSNYFLSFLNPNKLLQFWISLFLWSVALGKIFFQIGNGILLP